MFVVIVAILASNIIWSRRQYRPEYHANTSTNYKVVRYLWIGSLYGTYLSMYNVYNLLFIIIQYTYYVYIFIRAYTQANKPILD